MATHRSNKRIGTLLILATAIVAASPAAASSTKDDAKDCEPVIQHVVMVEHIVARAEAISVRHLERIEARAEAISFRHLERIEAHVAMIDREAGERVLRFERRLYTDIEPAQGGTLGWGIQTLVDITQLPARGARVAQHLFEALAKVTPRVLQTVL